MEFSTQRRIATIPPVTRLIRRLRRSLKDSMTERTSVPANSRPTFGRQQVVALIVTVLILVFIVAVVLPRIGDFSEAWTAIQSMDTADLILIIGATVAMVLIYVLPFIAALPGLRFWPAFKVRQTGFMISNVLPAGGAFGLAVQYGMLQSYGVGPAPSTAAIGITGAWNTFVTLTLPVLALVGVAVTGEVTARALTVTVIAALVVIVAVGVFALVLRSESTARAIGRFGDRSISWVLGIFGKTSTVDATSAVVHFRSSIIDIVRVRWMGITAANFGQQLSQFLILYLAVVALQGSWLDPISPVEALAAFSFGRLATFIPVPPGGLGTSDALIVSILAGFGLDSGPALAATMIWRAATFFPQVAIGVGTLIAFQRDRRRRPPDHRSSAPGDHTT